MLSLWRSLALDYGAFTAGYGSCNLFKDLSLFVPSGDHYSQFVDDCEDQSQELKSIKDETQDFSWPWC